MSHRIKQLKTTATLQLHGLAVRSMAMAPDCLLQRHRLRIRALPPCAPTHGAWAHTPRSSSGSAAS
eukprot:2093118-Alexandrium_andersonii.AAC.1